MFKDSFKYYKSKKKTPCLKDVLDMNYSEVLLEESKIKQLYFHSERGNSRLFGFKATEKWEIFEFTHHPGLILIKNPFTPSAQRYWTIRCLRDYSRRPNRRNIDYPTENAEDWWTIAQKDKTKLKSLRWTTLGYHHNWNTKVYNAEEKGEFPEDLKSMIEFLAAQLGYKDFNAEAAIINYYQMDSSLSGHTDHSEYNLDAPLFSISFGQTAIFLIGGKTLEEEPTPIFLRSGDIIVMSKESRLSYHAVPKIMQADSKSWEMNNEFNSENDDNEKLFSIDDSTWELFGDYLNHSRININIRQVL